MCSSVQEEPGLDGREAHEAFGDRSWQASRGGLLALGLALLAPLAAVWAVPWFVTQDGPAHIYNAQILAESFDASSPSRAIYTIAWKPIPNWMGQLILAGLVSRLPAWNADRIMTTVTLAGLAAATLWLRWRVAGGKGLVVAAVFSALLAMNLMWLLGFTNFLLGSCLFPITLGVWWQGRYRLTARRIAGLSGLLCLGYFCHLVSLGLTAVGMAVLATAGPVQCEIRERGSSGWPACCARRSVSCRFSYSVISIRKRRGAAVRCGRCGRTWPIRGRRVPGGHGCGWVDPITLAIKDGLPFTSRVHFAFIVFAPVLWLLAGLVLWWYGRISGRPAADVGRRDDRSAFEPARTRDDRGAWLLLATLFLAGGIAGPGSFGANHGEFLPQRVILLGLIALVPVFDADLSRWPGRFLFRCSPWRSACNRRSSGTMRSTPMPRPGRSSGPVR